jgi:hypothetical protein
MSKVLIQEAKIRKILEFLEEQVEKEEKKKLNENELLHVALHIWEDVENTSHEWEISPSELLKMTAAVLFGTAVLRLDLKRIWNKILSISREKVLKLLKAAQIISKSPSLQIAQRNINQALGINVQPMYKMIEAAKQKNNGKKL